MNHSIPGLPEIPPDRADGSSSWVHQAFIFTAHLGQIPPALLLPAWASLIAVTCWPWSGQQLSAAILGSLFLILDWVMLALLPIKQRSWGPVTPSLLGLVIVRVLLSWLVHWLIPGNSGLIVLTLLYTGLSITAIYATWIEPFKLGVTYQELNLPHWQAPHPLRVLHISDIHFEHPSPREDKLLATLEKLAPDLILLTGDYMNLSSVYDDRSQAGIRDILSTLHAPLGVYAITGSPVVDHPEIVPRIFEGLPIHWLNNEAVKIEYENQEIWLIGIKNTYDEGQDIDRLRNLLQTEVPPDADSMLLYHTPDLMPEVAKMGVTLYLAGHTHGGQLRLPLYGALATSSRWGKRYEMGRYTEQGTTLYVSRGIGVEGLGAPRARFLAPPEIILWKIGKE